MGNQQQRPAPYQGNQGYPYGNNVNYGQGWRKYERPLNRKNPYHNVNQSSSQPNIISKLEDTLTQFMQMFIANQKNTDASIKNLETQVGQIAK